MIETYDYILSDVNNDKNNIKCKIEYDTENSYNKTFYFYDGKNWQKDFIDLNKLSPENKEEKNEFDDFVTKVHDFMVHGNLWEQLEAMDDGETITKKQYELEITANKI
ncbi:MAG: hypothetical protein BZ133_04630 [Methanosphaera sp. SHI613]|jgi:hypothetical protein|nr:MAG: hypothetical protein BZ133_04630 [Methanosphaera sp. SHI613]